MILEKSLFWLDLNETFPVDDLITPDFLHTTSSSATQYMGGGAFWIDKNQTTLYSMAGYSDSTISGQPNINAYIIQDDTWRTVEVAGGSFNKLNRANAMRKNWLPGMVTFDAADPSRPTWTNTTEDIPYFWGSTTQYVRFGKQGVLVSVGGYSGFGSGVPLREMSSVQVYDLEARTWDVVYATGDIPQPRLETCSILSAAPDDSNFQMTIYGGHSEAADHALEDVYVLTMPAFHWIKINDTGNNETKLGQGVGRRRHFCNAHQDRSMFVLGGGVIDGEGKAFNLSSCNKDYPPIKLLDTTTFEWRSQYPLLFTTYQVPQPVIDVIGGGPDGGARPASAFQSGTALPLFATTVARYDPDSSSPSATTGNGSPGSGVGSTNTPSFPNNAGPIAGGVVGGLAAFALIGVATFFLRKKRRRDQDKDKEWEKPELSSEAPLPPWAPSRPNNGTYEADGGFDAKPREMDGGEGVRREMDGWHGVEAPHHDGDVMRSEMSATGPER